MKKVSYLWSIIALLSLLLLISLAGNVGLLDLPQKLKSQTSLQEAEIVFQLSDIKFELRWNLDSNIKEMALLTAEFTAENISKTPQTIAKNNLCVFDSDECQYEISDNYHSRVNPFYYSETINPNSKKKISLVFEVPKGKLYCIGFSDNIEITGIQEFNDAIRNAKYSYKDIYEMKEIVKGKSVKTQYPDNNIERAVDLNDYFNSSTGWDDETDWNNVGLEDEESQKAFDKVLENNGVYWSEQKQCWVEEVACEHL